MRNLMIAMTLAVMILAVISLAVGTRAWSAEGVPDAQSSNDYVKGWCDGFAKAHEVERQARDFYARQMTDKGGALAVQAVDLYLVLIPRLKVNVILKNGEKVPCDH